MMRQKRRRSGGGLGQAEARDRRVGRPRFDHLDICRIDRSDALFSMSFEPDLGRLRESVKQVGVLEPIWAREKGSRFQIVNGFRRIDVALGLGKRDVPALVWKEGEVDDRLAFRMSLHENILTREFNPAEKALVIEKLLGWFAMDRDEVIQTYLPLLNLEPNETVLCNILVINTFRIETRRYVIEHRTSLGNIMRLAKFSEEEQETICRFLSALRLGGNVVREILTFLQEISDRDGVSIHDLLSDPELEIIMSGEGLSGPQKIDATRRLLRRRRYPRLWELEQKFRTWRNQVKLPPQVVVAPPVFFEGDRFRIEIQFKSVKEYEAILNDLQNISKDQIKGLLTIKGYGSDTN